MYPRVVLERFVSVVGASAVAVLAHSFCDFCSSAREELRRAAREVATGYRPGRSAEPDGDYAKFGKDAQTHYSVQGASQSFEIISETAVKLTSYNFFMHESNIFD